MIVSPDAPQILGKGLFQVVGVVIKILVCIAMINEVSIRPVLFSGYIRLSAMVLAIVALIAVAQFGMANLTRTSSCLGVRIPKQLGGRQRVVFAWQSRWNGAGEFDLQEPSALGMVLGLGAASR